MSENLVACEFEDSTNCVWNAQEQGNGIGESFVNIEGEIFYIETTLDCPPNKVPGWLDENGNPQGCVDNNPTPLEPKELPVLEEVPEVVVEVPVIVDHVPEELALTGTGDVVVGLLIGLALLAAGVVLFIKGRKNK